MSNADDLVKRLRDGQCPENTGCGTMNTCACALLSEAAERIEHLEAQKKDRAQKILGYIAVKGELSGIISDLRKENEELKTVMIAAAEEIHRCWDAHCDKEGYGPANLMNRLERGLASTYSCYSPGAFAALEKELTTSTAKVSALQDRVKELEAELASAMRGKDRWVIVRESVLDVGLGADVRTGGRPESGYALLSDAATFESQYAAIEAIRETGMKNGVNMPLGWVVMPLSRLLPDVFGDAAIDAALSTQENTNG